ncbi:MAG: ABC transporter ATP-binding protein [Clostridium sp.]|nr:ABC transporter ATP-binding protein [Clostridium sp.]
MEPILLVKNLSKAYDGFRLEDVCLEIPKGSIVGLIGENGAGKSTTLNAILDLIKRDSGTVTFWGEELSANPHRLKEDIGVVFDDINFYETLTPAQIGKICAKAYRQWDPGQYAELAEGFRLPLHKEIKTFSKGMKRKLCIAAALSHHPRLLILDEPTSGLDPVMREDILEVFLDFVQDDEHSILMSSHISTDLEKIADYITFIHQGKVLFSKNKDQLIYGYGIIRCTSAQFEAIAKDEMLAWRKCDYQWEVLVADKEASRRKYRDMVVDNATIDDILLLYVKGEHSN